MRNGLQGKTSRYSFLVEKEDDCDDSTRNGNVTEVQKGVIVRHVSSEDTLWSTHSAVIQSKCEFLPCE